MPDTRTDDRLQRLWQPVLEQIADWSAHEVKDVLNGVSLNLEVIRSRSVEGDAGKPVAPFATAAAAQLEILSERVGALLFLSRPVRDATDVAVTLRHLAALLVPAVRADGGALTMEGLDHPAPTAAPAHAVRLALGATLLAVMGPGGRGRCRLDTASGAAGAVVRFSHESGSTADPHPEITRALADNSIDIRRSDADLLVVFPGP